MVCSKNWIYTGISRAKETCVLIGKLGTALGFCKRDALSKRKTFLAELIAEKVVEERAAELAIQVSEPRSAGPTDDFGEECIVPFVPSMETTL
jgi:hypothetical protein